jgi:hypothetical protein
MKHTLNDESCFPKPHSRKPRNFRKIVARIFSLAQRDKGTGKHGSWTTSAAVCLMLAATPPLLPAQSFKTLVYFDGTDGADPGANPEYVSLVQGPGRQSMGDDTVWRRR